MEQKLNYKKNTFGKQGLKVDLSNFILMTEVWQFHKLYYTKYQDFPTPSNNDKIYLDEEYDDTVIEKQIFKNRIKTTATDYAIANGVTVYNDGKLNSRRKGTVSQWTRIFGTNTSPIAFDHNGNKFYALNNRTDLGIVPVMRVDFNLFEQIDGLQIRHVKNKCNNTTYHTIDFGFYPKSEAKNSTELETLFQGSKLAPTGKKYTGHILSNGEYSQNAEYRYKKQRYVRVLSYDNIAKWFKVEPITWKIRNWNKVSQNINPKGTGTADFLDLRAEEAVMGGIPFFPRFLEFMKSAAWQNSSIRGFLNGYNMETVAPINRECKELIKTTGGNFSNNGGFLHEAFVVSPELLKQHNLTIVDTKQHQPTVQDTAEKNL